MNRIDRAINGINGLEKGQKVDSYLSRLNPLVKIAVTFLFLTMTVSFRPMQFSSLLLMAIYPVFILISSSLSFKKVIGNFLFFLPVILIMALLNPFFDRTPVFEFKFLNFNLPITRGMIYSASLIVKGVLTVFATYILVATTSMNEICSSIAIVGVPSVMVIQLMLAFRYINVFLEEVRRTFQAYSLRAPGQKGIHFKAWGSLTGGIILRSFDRAQEIYEAMNLRGFSMEYFFSEKHSFGFRDIMFLLSWTGIIIILRFFPAFEFIGRMFEKLMGAF